MKEHRRSQRFKAKARKRQASVKKSKKVKAVVKPTIKGESCLNTFAKLARPKPDTYPGEADVLKEISGLESLRAKRKYQSSDCLADPRRQPQFSCRQLGYKGEASRGAKLNRTIMKIKSNLLSPTGPREGRLDLFQCSRELP
ncbi:hypothetical protein Tco_1359783 [Tanacetum coccineum]